MLLNMGVTFQSAQFEKAVGFFHCPFGADKIKDLLSIGNGREHLGLGSAVMGVVGLAAGWHTLAYAIANMFPPIDSGVCEASHICE